MFTTCSARLTSTDQHRPADRWDSRWCRGILDNFRPHRHDDCPDADRLVLGTLYRLAGHHLSREHRAHRCRLGGLHFDRSESRLGRYQGEDKRAAAYRRSILDLLRNFSRCSLCSFHRKRGSQRQIRRIRSTAWTHTLHRKEQCTAAMPACLLLLLRKKL